MLRISSSNGYRNVPRVELKGQREKTVSSIRAQKSHTLKPPVLRGHARKATKTRSRQTKERFRCVSQWFRFTVLVQEGQFQMCLCKYVNNKAGLHHHDFLRDRRLEGCSFLSCQNKYCQTNILCVVLFKFLISNLIESVRPVMIDTCALFFQPCDKVLSAESLWLKVKSKLNCSSS